MDLKHQKLVDSSKTLVEIEEKLAIVQAKISQHTDVTKDQFKYDILTANPEQAAKILDNLFNGTVQKRADGSMADNMVNNPLTKQEIANLQSQVERVYINALTSKFTNKYDDNSVSMNHGGLSKFLEDNEEAVMMFVGEKGMLELKDLTFLHHFDGKELKNMGQLKIQTFKNIMEAGGLNIGTMVSNYKQIAVGRLSRAYVVATTFQNMVRKAFDVSDLSTYRATGFDWEMYEKALKNRGHATDASAYVAAKNGLVLAMKGLGQKGAQGVKDALTKQGKNVLKAGVSGTRLWGEPDEMHPDEKKRRVIAVQKWLDTPAVREIIGKKTVKEFLGEDYDLSDEGYNNLMYSAVGKYKEESEISADDLMGGGINPAPVSTSKEGKSAAMQLDQQNLNEPQSGVQEASEVPNSPDEELLADSAAELLGFRKHQAKLRAGKIDRKGTYNPKTGEMTWLA